MLLTSPWSRRGRGRRHRLPWRVHAVTSPEPLHRRSRRLQVALGVDDRGFDVGMAEDRPGRVDPDLPPQAGCCRMSQAIRGEPMVLAPAFQLVALLVGQGLLGNPRERRVRERPITGPMDRPAITGYVVPIARLALGFGRPLPLLRGLVGR